MPIVTTRSSIALALALALTACGGSPSATGPTTRAAPAPMPPASIFELGEITVLEGANPMLKIHADGTTELGGHDGTMTVVWKPGPTLRPDGSIEVGGKAVAQLDADGSVRDRAKGTLVPITVKDDKVSFTSLGANVGIQLAVNGSVTLIGGNARADQTPSVVGADSAGKRRAVLFMMGLMLGGGPPTATSTP
jgi:hypothetical protein